MFGKLVAWLKVAASGHDMGDFEPPDGFKGAPFQPEEPEEPWVTDINTIYNM